MSNADAEIGVMLEGLCSDEAEHAWRWFLSSYGDLLYTTVRKFSRDKDGLGDCFLFVCEKLADKRYRRLRAFKVQGQAQFSTWLRAVARNLCLDWLRSRFGRKQMFRSVTSLPEVEQAIFRCLFQHGMSQQQCWLDLQGRGMEIPYPEFEEHASRIQKLLTSRQLWLLSTSQVSVTSLDSSPGDKSSLDVRDPSPNPEEIAVLNGIQRSVSKAIQSLSEADRLLIQLRYFQGLGLAQVAGLVGLNDAQMADRRIRDALECIRQSLGLQARALGKRKSASV